MLDMIMPIMDDWQVVRSLRANPETKDIPILAARALFHQSDLNTCIEQGCSGYIKQAVHDCGAEEEGRRTSGGVGTALGR